jgi:hypothetical protein
MRFYTKQHKYYCGIDLHTRVMYLCILKSEGETVLHRNVAARPEPFRKAVAPYRDGLVVGAECMFNWYWLADLCEDEGIPFVLGHALYMKAIHGGKVKNDRVDSLKIATLLRGGMFPIAYVYPRHMRPTRDLLRRRQALRTLRRQDRQRPPQVGLSEAATLFIRHSERGKKLFARLERKHSKGKALSVLAHKLGRATYFMLQRNQVFDMNKFVA